MNINIHILSSNTYTDDLPIISVAARKGAEVKTVFTFMYREYTGGIFGLRTMKSQADRLTRTLSTWADIDKSGLDHVIMGDMNLCFRKWTAPTDTQKQLIDKVKAAQMTLALEQMICNTTRTQKVLDVIKNSIIVHLYTNCSSRLTTSEVTPVGESDHLGLVVTKLTKVSTTRTSSLRLTEYKNMNTVALINDINWVITSNTDLDEAAEVFAREVDYYQSKYANVKVSPGKKI